MKLAIKQYEYEKKEIESKEIELPTETTYYFETGVRRSIRIVPIFTTWNKERFDKEEELYELKITCVYLSSECIVEKFTLYPKDIEKIFYADKHKRLDFVRALVHDWFDNRTKEQFEADLNGAITQFKQEE
jgi:hypothetical protein